MVGNRRFTENTIQQRAVPSEAPGEQSKLSGKLVKLSYNNPWGSYVRVSPQCTDQDTDRMNFCARLQRYLFIPFGLGANSHCSLLIDSTSLKFA